MNSKGIAERATQFLKVSSELITVKTLILMSILILATTYPQGRYELPDGTVLDGVETIKGVPPRGALSILGLRLGSSTFNDVRSVLGRMQLLPRTEDPHEADMICYFAIEDSNVHLSFSAGWPENPTDKLTSFTISLGGFKHSEKCTPSDILTPRTATANGLRLGLIQDEVKAILGQPSKITHTWMIYTYQVYRAYAVDERTKMPQAPGDGPFKGEWSYHDLVARFSNGKMDLLIVSLGGEPSW